MATPAREIHELNICHYRKLLETEADPSRRQTILSLLRQEEAELAKIERPVSGGSSPANRASGTE